MGALLWSGIDYFGEGRHFPNKGWSGALFSMTMEKRPIAYIMQSYWTKKPMVHFAVMDYSIDDSGTKEHWISPPYYHHWEFMQFEHNVLPFMIATNCERVELYINDKYFLLPKPDTQQNKMITGFVPYLPGTVTVIGKNGGVEVCREVIKTPNIATKLKFEQEEQFVSLEKVNGFEDLNKPYQMMLKVRAFDKEDNPVFRESAKVRFLVEGPAEIVGCDGGDVKSNELITTDRIHLFGGQAAVGIRITGKGRIKVTAHAAGMFAGSTVIVAE